MEICFEELKARVIYSERKTVAIQLKMNEIIVRAPMKMEREEILSLLIEKKSWIRKHLNQMEEMKKKEENLRPFTGEEIRKLAEQALLVIPEKVRKYAERIGVSYGRITIRNQRSRWGSCSSKGNLNFNCLLMLFPEEIIDYVVVHELCHRKQMNHSPEFYKEVEKVLPEYKQYSNWLKENGSAYLRRL